MSDPSKAKRSKGGCLVCRGRRIKCDESKPECSRCVKYVATCVYPEKKPYDSEATARKLQRRHRPRVEPESSAQVGDTIAPDGQRAADRVRVANVGHPPNVASLTSPLAPSSAMSLPHGPNTAMTGWFSRPTPPPEFLKRVATDDEELNMLHHCLTYSLSILVVDENPNPWRTTVAPLFLFPNDNQIDTPQHEPVSSHPDQVAASRPPQSSSDLAEQQPQPLEPDLWALLSSIFDENPCYDMPIQTDTPSRASRGDSYTTPVAPSTSTTSASTAPVAGSKVSPSVLALKAAMLHLGAGHLSYLCRLSSRPESSSHYQAKSGLLKEKAVGYMRQACADPNELRTDAFLATCTTMLFAGVLTISATWREVLRMGYKAFEADGESQQMTFGMGPAHPTPSARIHLMESLTVFDIFAAWSTGNAPRILAGDTTWWMLLGMAATGTTMDSVQHSTGMHRQAILLIAEVTTAVSETLGKLTLNQLPGLQLLARLAQYRVVLETEALTPRVRQGSLAAWHACNIEVRRTLLRQTRDHQETQNSAMSIIELCELIATSGKVEYLNWVLLAAASVVRRLEQRKRITHLLDSFITQCAYDIDAMKAITAEMWKRMDQHGDDDAVGWREVMVELGLPIIMI
ncbi:hypothetical protein IAR50_001311 [Cryptococcus sp. DSM 104548]